VCSAGLQPGSIPTPHAPQIEFLPRRGSNLDKLDHGIGLKGSGNSSNFLLPGRLSLFQAEAPRFLKVPICYLLFYSIWVSCMIDIIE
jgi:hypothetical protein